MGAVITQAGLDLLAQLAAASQVLNVDTFIYADIVGLDPAATPPLAEARPAAEDVMHEGALTQQARVGSDTVVFSHIMGADVGDFYFNWIGLWCTEHNTLVGASYVPRQQKIASVGATMGNTLTKNFTLQYTSLASIANVTIDPATWQLDVRAELIALQAVIDAHAARTDNPHAVTREQIGAMGAVDFPALLGANGWQQLPGGLLVQWGTNSVPAGVSTTCTFPIAFPHAAFSIVAQFEVAMAYSLSCGIVSASQFRVNHNNGTGAANVYWFAVGY